MIVCKNISLTENHLLLSSIIFSIELLYDSLFIEYSISFALYSDRISRNDMLPFFSWRDRITACMSGSDVLFSLTILLTPSHFLLSDGEQSRSIREPMVWTNCSGIRIWTIIVYLLWLIPYLLLSLLYCLWSCMATQRDTKGSDTKRLK